MPPESLKVIDPACGSGHILVYAFKLLAAMYEEAGHVRRDIPRLILQNNLTGCEIDPRAAQMASFALAMTACEWDSRFLRRTDKVSANIVCLRPAEIDADELAEMPYLAERTALLDAMAHMGECGSLFAPAPEDIAALERADDELDAREAGGDLLAYRPHAAVAQMLANCKPLIETYDAVIANPPYMGGKNMGMWLSNWVKRSYPDVKSDLFSCFIERNLQLAADGGQLGFMTPYVWMFIGSYEKLRNKLIEEATITSLVQLEYSGFAGATVPICTFTLQKGRVPGYLGGYVRLSDFVGAANQAPKTLEAIANPTCGWFYRRSADAFKSIPGTPIAYWASEKQIAAFKVLPPLSACAYGCNGMTTGENDRFLRVWHEVSISRIGFGVQAISETRGEEFGWFPYNKGGEFRKWYGNRDYVINWEDDGRDIRANGHLVPRSMSYMFRRGVSWSKISSGRIAFRVEDPGRMFDVAGLCLFPLNERVSLAALAAFGNATVASRFLEFLSPTLNFEVGNVCSIPLSEKMNDETIEVIARACVDMSIGDWHSRETSCDFLRHPMV